MNSKHRFVLPFMFLVVAGVLVGCVGAEQLEGDESLGVSSGPEFAQSATVDLASVTTYVSVLQPSGTIGPKVLDMRDYSTANGGRAQLWQWRTTGEVRNQRWTITQVGTVGSPPYAGFPYYQLKNQLSGKCLDMATDVPTRNGVRVQQWDCEGTTNQMWIAVPVVSGNRWVELVNLYSNRCLDVTDVRYADGALLQVWDCHGGWNQRWNID